MVKRMTILQHGRPFCGRPFCRIVDSPNIYCMRFQHDDEFIYKVDENVLPHYWRTMVVLLTSDGLSSPALQAEMQRQCAAVAAKAGGGIRMWYIPTAALHEGANSRVVASMSKQIADRFSISDVAVIDPEHVRHDELERQISSFAGGLLTCADLPIEP
eukprot:6202872-Pleurochrysis_carterae.AAC.4